MPPRRPVRVVESEERDRPCAVALSELLEVLNEVTGLRRQMQEISSRQVELDSRLTQDSAHPATGTRQRPEGPRTTGGNVTCFRCGGKGHYRRNCRAHLPGGTPRTGRQEGGVEASVTQSRGGRTDSQPNDLPRGTTSLPRPEN